jgi:ribosome-associated heat shock protein Hsp15
MSSLFEIQSMRIDKWLWCVRAYRTRSKSAAACKAAHVHLNGQVIKPATPIRAGDLVVLEYPRLQRTLKVVALLPRRVGAPIAIQHYEDLTPESEYDQFKKKTLAQSIVERDRGSGRPTKKQRRELEKWLEDLRDEG